MASGPDHMHVSTSFKPLVDRKWQATTAVAALTSALYEPHAVAQPAEHVVVRRDSSQEEFEGMSDASVGTVLSAPPAIAVARNSSSWTEASKALRLPKAEKVAVLTNEPNVITANAAAIETNAATIAAKTPAATAPTVGSGEDIKPKAAEDTLAGKPVAMAVDIETHGWQGAGADAGVFTEIIGEFGNTCWVPLVTLDFSRVVQVGWCFFDARGEVIERQELCVSDAVSCSSEAIKVHKLTDKVLRERGNPLDQVLERLHGALRLLHHHGGKLVAYNLEFDVGILVREFRRREYGEAAALLAELAIAGTCTMNQMRDIQMPLRVGRPSLRKSCAVLGVKLPTNGTWHNALYDAELAGLLHFRLKEIENKGCKVQLGLAPNDPPRLVQYPTGASAPSSHPVQPFSRGMRVWYRDACDEIVAATIKDVLPPSSRLRYDIQTDAGERIDTNNIRQWSEVPPTAETWESTQSPKRQKVH